MNALTPQPSGAALVLAAIQFANAAMLAGLAAVGIPVVIHLLNRRRPRHLVFPTIRFLREAMASQSRIHRLRHWILLLLRCAAIALLALAFARPEWWRAAEAATPGGRDTVAVLLVDTSASMGFAPNGRTALDDALATAAAIIDHLDVGRGDSANVLLVGQVTKPLRPLPTKNLAAVKADLERVELSAEPAGVNGALTAVAQQFVPFFPSRKELHILSDFQRTNWADADFTAMPRDVHVVVHRVGPDTHRDNVAIAGITAQPQRPIVGQLCTVTMRLVNHGGAAARADLRVRRDDGFEWRRADIPLPPHAAYNVPLSIRFESPGAHELTATITADALEIDDRAVLAVRVLDKMPIVLCTDANLAEGVTSSYLLARALAPRPSENETVDLRVVHSRSLSAESLAGAEVVLVDGVDALGPATAKALYEFMQAGGGVAMFLGPDASPGNLAVLEGVRPDHEDLPAQAYLTREHPRDKPTRIVTDRFDAHPLLRPFAGTALRSFDNVLVYRHYVTRPPRPGADVIATLQTGDAAIAAAPVGLGTLLICNVSPDPEWSDIARHAAFPGLVHQIATYLRPQMHAAAPAYAGTAPTHRWTTDETYSTLQVADPAGRPIAALVHRDGRTVSVTLSRTPQPGFYHVRAGGRVVESIAVNVDPVESDLERVADEAFAARVQGTAPGAGPRLHLDGSITGDRQGRPLWAWAMAGAMAMLAVEMLCLAAWRR